jgi:hypothetical protein
MICFFLLIHIHVSTNIYICCKTHMLKEDVISHTSIFIVHINMKRFSQQLMSKREVECLSVLGVGHRDFEKIISS